jgi:hypothetical protein
MVYLYLISVWGGEPVMVDKYHTMDRCRTAIRMSLNETDYTMPYARFVCIPDRTYPQK